MTAPPRALRIRLIDRLTPAAVLLVSRAWILREVATVDGIDDAQRAQLADELLGYEPERRFGLRNSFIAWLIMLGGALLARLIDVPPWIGFVAGLLIVLALARELATRALRWKLGQMLEPPSPGAEP